MGLNTSEEAGGRNVFNLPDLLKSSKDSQLQQIKLLPSALQKDPPRIRSAQKTLAMA